MVHSVQLQPPRYVLSIVLEITLTLLTIIPQETLRASTVQTLRSLTETQRLLSRPHEATNSYSLFWA
jgi:hypothetical protein